MGPHALQFVLQFKIPDCEIAAALMGPRALQFVLQFKIPDYEITAPFVEPHSFFVVCVFFICCKMSCLHFFFIDNPLNDRNICSHTLCIVYCKNGVFMAWQNAFNTHSLREVVVAFLRQVQTQSLEFTILCLSDNFQSFLYYFNCVKQS